MDESNRLGISDKNTHVKKRFWAWAERSGFQIDPRYPESARAGVSARFGARSFLGGADSG